MQRLETIKPLKKKYYKLVNRKGRIRSSLISNLPTAVIYKRNQWTEAPVGGLLVFNTLAAGKNACNAERGTRGTKELWECEVADPVKLPFGVRRLPVGFGYTLLVFEEFWRGHFLYSKEGAYGIAFPKGTVAFRYVRLVGDKPVMKTRGYDV